MTLIFSGTITAFNKSDRSRVLAFLITVLLFYQVNIQGQDYISEDTDTLIRTQLSLKHDNDFFTLSDRYYSSGLFLSYTKRLMSSARKNDHQQLSLTIGQEIFTPSNIITTDISEQDRPYVGFSGLWASWSRVRDNRAIDTRLLLGIAGNNSGAGGFQRWYHNLFVVSDPPVWVGEMNNSFHANLYLNLHREWWLAPLPFSVSLGLQPEFAFGTRDQYGEINLIAFFGRRNPLMSSMAYKRIGSTAREIFFSLQAGYRKVFYNGMLQGNALGDDSIFLIDASENLIFGALTVQHRFQKNEYRFGYQIQSAEAAGNKSHKFITLSYARNF
ncbi:MAG: DUF2219 family protein [Flavobacteriaceae bacterium]|nr:DUF2219 family protein [Flavobacteriaceae bacterium]